MATRVGLGYVLMTPLESPPSRNLYFVQESGTYLPQKPSYSHFSLKIFKFSLPWQPGSVWGKCKSHHWIRRRRKPRTWCKNQEHISHRSPVIPNFLLKFSNFRRHSNQGRSGVSANDTIGFAAIENPYLVQESGTYLL